MNKGSDINFTVQEWTCLVSARHYLYSKKKSKPEQCTKINKRHLCGPLDILRSRPQSCERGYGLNWYCVSSSVLGATGIHWSLVKKGVTVSDITTCMWIRKALWFAVWKVALSLGRRKEERSGVCYCWLKDRKGLAWDWHGESDGRIW